MTAALPAPRRRGDPQPDGRHGQITVVIVDDHTLFRDGVREILATEPGVAVVGEGGSGADAVRLAAEHRPDVVLLDVTMSGLSPRTVLARIRARSPSSRVVVLTMHSDPSLAYQLMRLGVRAYLVKDVGREQLCSTIRIVMHDDERTIMASSYHSFEDIYRPATDPEQLLLSNREREVLELAAEGCTTSAIAETLSIAEGTVRRHFSRAYRKLGVTGRLDAISRATGEGLLHRRSSATLSDRPPPGRQPP